MLLSDAHTLMAQQNRATLNRHSREQEFNRKRIAEAMSMPIRHTSQNE